jgi:hypothetical protein
MLASRHRATAAGTFRDSQAVARREQRQESRTTQWDPARDDSVLDPALCWCSPKGRGDRLKIGTVGVRIPPPAPALRGLRLSPRAVSRRRLHQSNAKDLPSPDLSQRRPASRHRRSVPSSRCSCPDASGSVDTADAGSSPRLGAGGRRCSHSTVPAGSIHERLRSSRGKRSSSRRTPISSYEAASIPTAVGIGASSTARTIRHTHCPIGRRTFSSSSRGRVSCAGGYRPPNPVISCVVCCPSS